MTTWGTNKNTKKKRSRKTFKTRFRSTVRRISASLARGLRSVGKKGSEGSANAFKQKKGFSPVSWSSRPDCHGRRWAQIKTGGGKGGERRCNGSPRSEKQEGGELRLGRQIGQGETAATKVIEGGMRKKGRVANQPRKKYQGGVMGGASQS